MDDHLIGVLSNIGMFSFLALSAYLLLLVNEISFGQQAYFALSAYASGIVTAMWGWDLWAGMIAGMLVAAAAAVLVGIITLRLRGLYFSVATLAFAELVRLCFEIFIYQVEKDGEAVGPNGSEGFRDIRWIFENDVTPFSFMIVIFALLFIVLLGFFLMERSRLGSIFRLIGGDRLLAETQGVNVVGYKLLATALAGAIAGIGGCLYAHLNTYVEPKVFNIMLGVHSLAYGLIGGLGTALGPIIGVVIDIGFLESIRIISGYRMIVFGGLVALLLIVMPRGILDETRVYRLRRWWRRLAGRAERGNAVAPR